MQGVVIILEAGSLSNDNDDRSENKMCPLKFNCVYLNPFDLSNEGDFSWSWILKDFIQVQNKRRKSVCHIFTSSTKCRIRRFQGVIM